MAKIILGVSSSFCANFLKGQVGFLVNNGYDVVIISGPGEEIGILAKKENAKLYTINFTKRISPFADIICLFQIISILKKEKPDIVNAGNPKSGFLIMLACWLMGIKRRIFTLHGLLSDTHKGFKGWLIASAERISCNIARSVIVVSPSLKLHAESRKILAPSKGIIIEKGSCNGIDLDYFSKNEIALAQASKLKEELGLSGHEIIIGYVGRLSKDKGIEILFEAFNTLIQKFPSIRLMVAGPIETGNPFSKKTLHQLYEDENIFYLGKLADVTPVYCLMDLLVVSSLREGFGNVLIEAAAMDVPVIAPNIPGCRDSLRDGYNGEFFESGNADSLSTVLEKLIAGRDYRMNLGNKGRQFVSENFAQEKIWNGQLTLYNKLLTQE